MVRQLRYANIDFHQFSFIESPGFVALNLVCTTFTLYQSMEEYLFQKNNQFS